MDLRLKRSPVSRDRIKLEENKQEISDNRYNNNNNYKTSTAPISSKRIKLSDIMLEKIGFNSFMKYYFAKILIFFHFWFRHQQFSYNSVIFKNITETCAHVIITHTHVHFQAFILQEVNIISYNKILTDCD